MSDELVSLRARAERNAVYWNGTDYVSAVELLALLDRLEAAERERDEAIDAYNAEFAKGTNAAIIERAEAAEARLLAAQQALREIAEHPIVSERGPDEDCDWHCTTELRDCARAALAALAAVGRDPAQEDKP